MNASARYGLLLIAAGFALAANAPVCRAQDLLNQDKDQLLQGFDVEPEVLAKFPAKPQGVKFAVFKLLAVAIPVIDLDTENGEAALNVKAPFVKVKLDADKKHISVRVPFVKVDTSTKHGINVKAPLVRVHTSAQNGIDVKAPLVRVHTSAQNGISLKAAMLKINPVDAASPADILYNSDETRENEKSSAPPQAVASPPSATPSTAPSAISTTPVVTPVPSPKSSTPAAPSWNEADAGHYKVDDSAIENQIH